MDYKKMYERWLNFDYNTKAELENLSDDEIKDRFYKDLEFGTGGLRGVIEAGTNRMNKYVVRRATQGIANYILKQNIKNPKVALAYDSRKYSDVFAKEAALVLNANEITTYIYNELKPTPMLSFAVRFLHAAAGIVITASHNPKEYNGYKVYWSDGGQITDEHAREISDEIKKVDYEDAKTIEMDKAILEGRFNFVPSSVEEQYFKEVNSLIINKKAIEDNGDRLNIIYTPLHGTGNKPVRKALSDAGFKNIHVVPSQELPDSNFSTVKYPNPEEHEVFTDAIRMAKEMNADLILGTDPDCDRVGVVVKNNVGEYVVLTGNQTGILLTNYVISMKKIQNIMPPKPVVVKTIVTTELAADICRSYGVKVIDVLTGFKYIGEKIKEFEDNDSGDFLIGFEESYGYLLGTFVRDKDGVIACQMISEMTAYYKGRGMSLYDGLSEIYKKYGYCLEDLRSITFKGMDGSKKIKSIMESLRNDTPKSVAGLNVIDVKDYKKKIEIDVAGNTKTISLPEADVIQLVLKDKSMVSIRPSGTEPKIKFYFSSRGKDIDEARANIERIEEDMFKITK
jgi:phosphoglucomutase